MNPLAMVSLFTRTGGRLFYKKAHHSILVASLFSTSVKSSTPPFFIDPAQLMQQGSSYRGDNVKFLDVRAPDQYSTCHLPNAINCHSIFTYLVPNSGSQGVAHLMETFQELFQTAGLNTDDHIITYEDSLNTLYGASCRGLYLLKLLGHDKVSILNGGINRWLQDGYPTATTVRDIPQGNFTAKWCPDSLWSDKNDVLNSLNDTNTVVLDVRDYDEWLGTSSSPYGADFTPRKGRIPGAVHILWKDFMETSQKDGLNYLKKPNDIIKLCASKGITKDHNIIIYCFKGARASNTYVALKEAGFDKVTNYFASWNEWSRKEELPVDSQVLTTSPINPT